MKTRVRRRRVRRLIGVAIAAMLVGYSYLALSGPLPTLAPKPTTSSLQLRTAEPVLTWPNNSQTAVGVVGTGILETHGKQAAAPIASVAKLITALTVLNQKPLHGSEQGPLITLTANDVALYNAYAAQNGSVMAVKAGEQISEYQMLQAIMLPSANNIADSLAVWAYGSLDAYTTAANTYLAGLGLSSTHVGSDASGLAPDTTSTAHDLVRLGKLAMVNPVLAGIAGQSTASGIPVAGTIKNVNFLLGTNGITGIKTGNTDQAGGVYLAAARVSVNHKPVTVVTAVIGSPTLFVAMKDSLPLIRSAQANFKPVSVVKTGTVVGTYPLPWGGSVPAVVTKDLSLSTWSDGTIPATINLDNISSRSSPAQNVGNVVVAKSAYNNEKSVAVRLSHSPGKPTVWWRLTHPFN